MSRRAKFREFQKYAVCYGKGHVDRLSRYDVVIVEPIHIQSEEVQFLQSTGSLVLAYVSVMEIHPNHPLNQEVEEADFLYSEGPARAPILQPQYHNRMMDLTSVHWRGVLMRHVGRLITQAGYDGVFLDTIGDVESPSIPRGIEQFQSAVHIVTLIRQWFPDAILIQNNGLELLCVKTAAHLDGIVWENPPLWHHESRNWVTAIAGRLEALRDAYNLKVLVLFEGSRQDTRNDWIRGRSFADEHSFTAYFSPTHYLAFNG